MPVSRLELSINIFRQEFPPNAEHELQVLVIGELRRCRIRQSGEEAGGLNDMQKSKATPWLSMHPGLRQSDSSSCDRRRRAPGGDAVAAATIAPVG